MKKFINYCKEFMEALGKSKAGAYAASTAFFVFLSLIPFFMLFCSILPYTNIEMDTILFYIDEFVPSYISEWFIDLFLEIDTTNAALISVSALVTLWVAGKGLWALACGMDSAYGVNNRRNVISLRLLGSFYTIIFLVFILAVLAIMVYGNVFLYIIGSRIPNFSILIEFLINSRFLFAWVIFTLLFQIMYTVIPSVKLKFSWQFPGALFSSIGWSLFSYGFSIYLKYFGDFSMYGSLTTIIISMFWLYYCMYILFIGAIINQFARPLIQHIKDKYEKRKIEKRKI